MRGGRMNKERWVMLGLGVAIMIGTYYFTTLVFKQECSANLCSDAIEIKQAQITVPPGEMKTLLIQGDEDQRATGGGFNITDDKNLFVWENKPSDNGRGWKLSVSNYGSNPRSAVCYAILVRVK
jgi:hypothetical protein